MCVRAWVSEMETIGRPWSHKVDMALGERAEPHLTAGIFDAPNFILKSESKKAYMVDFRDPAFKLGLESQS